MSHSHHPTARAGARHQRPLAIAASLTAVFMVVELIAGFATGSLALLSDAGHMATDTLGLAMALAAIVVAGKSDSGGQRTYGLYRLEILAALANAALLFGVAGYVLWEAINRLSDPPDVLSGPMLVVAIVGLLVNLVSWRLLREGSAESLNVEGAFLEVSADMIGSVGAIAAAVLLRYPGWAHADVVLGAAIGVFILPRAWRLGRQALRILVQAAPEQLDLKELQGRLSAIPGVIDIHDLHVWTLTSEMDVASVHLVIGDTADPHPVLDRSRDLLEDAYGIAHATLQVEPESHGGCTELTW